MLLRSLMLASAFYLLATPARADWTESGDVLISVSVNGVPTAIEAEDIGPDDVVIGVRIGTAGSSAAEGEATVSGETGSERRSLGLWEVRNGTGNVQSTFGAGGFIVGSGTSETSLDGVLEFLNSDVTGGIDVRHGTLRVRAGSRVGGIEVFPFGTAYISEFSHTGFLTAQAGSFVQITDSFVDGSGLNCRWRGTVRADDSHITCGMLQVELGGVAEIGLLSLGPSSLDVTGQITVGADLSLRNTDVTTGSLLVPSTVDMNGGTWTNLGALDVIPGNPGPTVLRIGSGANFHQEGLARVAGIDSAVEHLVVTGDGTLLEADQDLHLGEYFFLGNPVSYPGTLTVADGATIIVHGTFQIGSQAIVNLEPGGTIQAAAVNDLGGTINENGGELIVPEPGSTAAGVALLASLATLARRHHCARQGVIRRSGARLRAVSRGLRAP
jgi:hypothetical protein